MTSQSGYVLFIGLPFVLKNDYPFLILISRNLQNPMKGTSNTRQEKAYSTHKSANTKSFAAINTTSPAPFFW